jgi:hypothetical protein
VAGLDKRANFLGGHLLGDGPTGIRRELPVPDIVDGFFLRNAGVAGRAGEPGLGNCPLAGDGGL